MGRGLLGLFSIGLFCGCFSRLEVVSDSHGESTSAATDSSSATTTGEPTGEASTATTGETSSGTTTGEASTATSTGETTDTGVTTSGVTTSSEASTGAPAPVCGDGDVSPNEECDDNNDVPLDGCTGCIKDCGNGELDPDEECDDGNHDLGDTCSSSCERTAFMVFVTSVKYDGDFGGLEGADDACNDLAWGKLPGVYKAWLSDGNEGPDTRFEKVLLPYIRPDKKTIANNWQDLIFQDLQNIINRNENNMIVPGNGSCGPQEGQVWTNTTWQGAPKNFDHCMDWMSNQQNSDGDLGLLSQSNQSWTDGSCKLSCDALARLYCFEQPVQ